MMVKICSESDLKYILDAWDTTWRKFPSRWLKLEINNLSVNNNCNVGNVYTDSQVYNKPSF